MRREIVPDKERMMTSGSGQSCERCAIPSTSFRCSCDADGAVVPVAPAL